MELQWITTNAWNPSRAGDKAILEAAYRENPKPDKIARLDIVKRVSLNEKEVQASLPTRAARQQLIFAWQLDIREVQSSNRPIDLVPEPSTE